MAFYLGNYHFSNLGAAAVTAKAGGGQPNAVQLNGALNKIATVATIADSVKLPQAQAGTILMIGNGAANSANVFPSTGDAINSLGVNAAFALAGGKNAMFFCPAGGLWLAILSA